MWLLFVIDFLLITDFSVKPFFNSTVSVVKPLVVDGSAQSHALFLAYDQFSLSGLEAPMVLQEFINHSTCFS